MPFLLQTVPISVFVVLYVQGGKESRELSVLAVVRELSARGFLGFLTVPVTSLEWPWPMDAACERQNADEGLSHGTR